MHTLFGLLIYLIALVLGAMMWRRGGAGRKSLESLVGASEKDHHLVLRIAEKHPQGGSWKAHREWVRQESTSG